MIIITWKGFDCITSFTWQRLHVFDDHTYIIGNFTMGKYNI